MSKDFNPYHKWLGIPEKKCPPTFYELLGISLDEEHEEVIKTAAQRQQTHVNQFLASDHAKLVKQLVYQIDEAEFTLLSPELRREYDRREKLFKKRRRSRQVDPIAVSSHIPFSGGPTVGEETGFVREYAGIMTVLVVAFMVMAGFSFWLPWEKLEKSEEIASAVPEVVAEVKYEAKQPNVNVPEIATEPDVVPQPQGDPNFPKPVLSVTFDEGPNSAIRLDNRGATFVAGKVGKAMKCDGKSFAIVPVSNLPSGKAPRTIAVWLKSTGVSSEYNRHAISYGNHSPPSSMPFGILQLKKLWGLYGWGNQADIEVEVDNEWHHHCLIYDGKTLIYRFDGRILFKTTGTLNLVASSGPLVLGTYANLSLTYCFEGLIDEVLVYDTALSSEQVRTLIESQDPDFIVADNESLATVDVLISPTAVAPQVRPGHVRTLRGHSKYVPHAVISPDGKLIASGGNDKTVRLWELATGRELWRCDDFSTILYSVAISPDGNRVWACDRTTIKRLDVATGSVSKTMTIAKIDGMNLKSASFSTDCSRLAVQKIGGAILYDLWRGNKLRETKRWVPALQYGVNNNIYIGGNEGQGVVELRDANSLKLKSSFHGLRDRTMAFAVSANGQYVAASSGPSLPRQKPAENRVIVWETNGRIVQKFQFEGGWQWALVFSPDNRYLVTAGSGNNDDWFGQRHGADCSIRVWEVATKRLIAKFDGHRAAVLSLAATPDGQFLVSGSADSTIRIWRMPSTMLQKDTK